MGGDHPEVQVDTPRICMNQLGRKAHFVATKDNLATAYTAGCSINNYLQQSLDTDSD